MATFTNPSGVRAPIGAYSHCCEVKAGSDLIFVAGQVGVRPDGIVPDTIEGQTDAAYANVVTVLNSQGLGPEHIVKLQVFLTDRAYRDASNAARARHFGDARPTSTLLIVAGLAQPNLMIEVEAIAAR